MLKKNLLLVLLALSIFAATPAARADIDMPTCFPCKGN
jgi:hypothetical protein